MSNSNSDRPSFAGDPDNQPQLIQTAAAEELAARTHAERAPDGQVFGEVELDTSPTNRVSNKYSTEDFKPLRWGIDSLYLSFTGELRLEQEDRLNKLKKLAQSQRIDEQGLAQIALAGHVFEVKDKSSGLFPFALEDNCFRIQLSRASSKSMPMAYVKISSAYLTHKSVEEIVDDLRAALAELGSADYMPKVSRIDLFVDFASSIDMESWGRQAWVTRAHAVNQYSVKERFSGWTVGLGGDMGARLYDKVLEIITSDKGYLIPLWNAAGWDGKLPVWRLEFQFKREVLSQFKVQSLSSTLSHLNGLWSYATTEWLKLTIPTEGDSNRSRWPIHPLWGCLASVDFETVGGPLMREFSAQRIPSDRRLFDHGFSVLTSFMAREQITDVSTGFEAFKTSMLDYLHGRAINDGVYVDDFISERVAAKARVFNTVLNATDEASAIEAQANAYRRAKDGQL
jgi:hypothetical protein